MSETTETPVQKVAPKTITKTYYIKGVAFETINEYVAIRKHQAEFTVDTHLFQTKALETEYSTKEEEIRHLWETVEPMDPREAFEKYSSNAQRLMTVMSIMGPEKTFKALKSKLFDEQTIVKTQKRTFLKGDIDFGKTNKIYFRQPFDTNLLKFTVESLYKCTQEGTESFYRKAELLEKDYLINNNLKEGVDLKICTEITEEYYEINNLKNVLKLFLQHLYFSSHNVHQSHRSHPLVLFLIHELMLVHDLPHTTNLLHCFPDHILE